MNYMDWVEKYNLNFQLHIKNSDNSKIYKQKNLEEEVGTLSQLENVILDVVASSKINNAYYFKTTYKNELIGWLKPTDLSIKYFKTKKTEIKLNQDFEADNKLNQILEINTEKLKENAIKIFFSDSYTVIGDSVYCSVLLKDELLGFVKIEQTSFYINFNEEFKFINEKVSLYKDSKMEKPMVENLEHGSETFKSLGKFEDYDGVRVVVNGKRYWANINDTNLNIEIGSIQDKEEVIIDALFNQLQEKLDYQNKFYKQKINNLNENLNIMKEKDKENKLKQKQLREFLSSK